MLCEKGPVVWEVKHARFYGKHRQDELPGAPHTLIVARNVFDLGEVKYFLSNRLLGSGDVTLEWLLWVAFSRFSVERCFEVGKRELGMDHFEVPCWQAIHRYLYISQLSQLFCACVHQDLREINDREFVPYRRAGSHRSLCGGTRSGLAFFGKNDFLSTGRQLDKLLSTSQPASKKVPSQKAACPPAKNRHNNQSVELFYTS